MLNLATTKWPGHRHCGVRAGILQRKPLDNLVKRRRDLEDALSWRFSKSTSPQSGLAFAGRVRSEGWLNEEL